jgi:phosphohistidine phosphatase SixA
VIAAVANIERMKARNGIGLLFAAALSAAAAPAPAEHPPEPPPPPALIQQMRAGGLVLYLRHAMTERRPDADAVDFADCATQRNLSEEGRRVARLVGAQLARLGIRAAAVLASPFCRTRDTATLAFGAARIEPGLLSRGNPKDPEELARLPGLKALLSAPPEGRGNAVLVGHSGLLDLLAKVHVDEAEMAVFRPLGAGGYAFLGRIRAEHWQDLSTP